MWTEYIIAISSVITPFLLALLAAAGWKFRTQLERQINLEDSLRTDRVEIYNQILEPFVILLTSDEGWKSDIKNKNKDKSDVAAKKMISLEYRKYAFKLSLIGSDSVVKSYNDLMQYFYKTSQMPEKHDLLNVSSLLGDFLLEIRKSVGNEKTSLDNFDMLEWFLIEAREMRDKSKLRLQSK